MNTWVSFQSAEQPLLGQFSVSGNTLSKKYLYHYLLAITKKIKASGSGIAMIHMTKERMEKLVIPVPPLAEQIRITSKIDELMALCDQLEQQAETSINSHKLLVDTLLRTLTAAKDADELCENWARLSEHFDSLITTDYAVEQLKQIILQLAVMGKLSPQDSTDEPSSELLKQIAAEKKQLIKDKKIKRQQPLSKISNEEKPFELPAGWEFSRLGAALIKITDGTHHSPPNSESGDFLYISAKNIKHDGVLLDNATYVNKKVHDEIYARCNPEPGDILYIKDGATTGIATINNLSEPFSMLSSVALLKCPTKILNKYLLLSLRSPFFYEEMRAGMTGVAITRVTLKKLEDALIPIPPLKEQHRIVAKVSELMALCDQLKNHLSKAQTTQLHLADSAVYEVIGEPINNIEGAEDSREIMKITTILSLNQEKFDELALIAPIILELGGSADAKEVWTKTKLSLPEFYAQLKIEIDANYISKPARADF